MTELYCQTAALSTGSALRSAVAVLSDVSVPASKPLVSLDTLAKRIKHAIAEEGLSQNEVERRVGFGLSRYTTGKRGGTTVSVDKMQALANVLHVEPVWLLLGEGHMRRGGRDMTPAEEAMVLARRSGIREEAWLAAWDRYRDRADEMTALDWALAIHTEAQLLSRSSPQSGEAMATTTPLAGVDARPKPRRGSAPDDDR